MAVQLLEYSRQVMRGQMVQRLQCSFTISFPVKGLSNILTPLESGINVEVCLLILGLFRGAIFIIFLDFGFFNLSFFGFV
jgi:hypothetical protein